MDVGGWIIRARIFEDLTEPQQNIVAKVGQVFIVSGVTMISAYPDEAEVGEAFAVGIARITAALAEAGSDAVIVRAEALSRVFMDSIDKR